MNFKKYIKFALVPAIFFFFMFFHEQILFTVNKNCFNPCNSSIKYTIGTVDKSFGIEKEDFILAVKEAEEEWEKAININLFDFSEEGIKINLVYDYRQDATFEIENIDIVYQKDSNAYLDLEKEYNDYLELYNLKIQKFDLMVSIYDDKYLKYEKDVSMFEKNVKDGKKYSEEKYNQLVVEKEIIENVLFDIKEKQEEINVIANKINYLVVKINNLADILNISAEKYNNVVSGFEKEFEQGNYINKIGNKEINIYQFENRENLVQALTHELGHALGLGHSQNENDIMHWINSKENQIITSDSLSKLKSICYLD